MIKSPPRTKQFMAFTAIAVLFMSFGTHAYAQGAGIISLDDAIQKALRSSPRLESAAAAIRASEGEQRQAGAWQNPQLTVEAENFAGSGSYKGYSDAETTVGVSQLIELSGKPGRRADVAKEGISVSRISQNIETFALISDVKTAYSDAVAAQERLEMAQEQKNLAKKLFNEVSTRVDAAREPIIQKSKAEITLSSATFAEEKAARELDRAKTALANLWGGKESQYELQSDYFYIVEPPMAEQSVEELLEKSLYLKRMNAEQGRLQAIHRLEQIQAVPDPTVSVGMRDFRGADNQALVASVSFPLPVLNHNGGGIAQARENVTKAASDTQATRLSLMTELNQALTTMRNAYGNANNMKSSVLPAAEKAFSQSRKGYNAGKFPYLEVLDAQRTLFDVKGQYIDTLNEYHQAKATIDRLTATEAPKSQSQEGKQ